LQPNPQSLSRVEADESKKDYLHPDLQMICHRKIPAAIACSSNVGDYVSCMKQNQIEEGRFSKSGEGLGTVTNEMVRKRAAEIAIINGRDAKHLLDSDIEQARRELLGEERLYPTPTPEENLPESKRWEPVPGTPGRKRETVSAADEQTYAEELVEEGVADAEHDQQVASAREAEPR
jgi:hypothetical protein